MHTALRTLVMLLLIAVLLPISTPAAGQDTVPTGQIAFMSQTKGGDIYVIDANGDNLNPLTEDLDLEWAPDWSPDGTQIVYHRFVNSSDWEIYVMDADGENERPLTNDPAIDMSPVWSPDGTQIAFVSNRDSLEDGDNRDIYVMDADGENVRRLTNNPGKDVTPSWSPDGTKILFQSDRFRNQFNIYMLDMASGVQRPLTFGRATDTHAVMSPDGTQIVFVSENAGSQDIYVMDYEPNILHLAEPLRLTANEFRDNGPDWSPDGAWIVYYAQDDTGNYGLYIMRADGTDMHLLYDSGEWDTVPDWRPAPVEETADE